MFAHGANAHPSYFFKFFCDIGVSRHRLWEKTMLLGSDLLSLSLRSRLTNQERHRGESAWMRYGNLRILKFSVGTAWLLYSCWYRCKSRKSRCWLVSSSSSSSTNGCEDKCWVLSAIGKQTIKCKIVISVLVDWLSETVKIEIQWWMENFFIFGTSWRFWLSSVAKFWIYVALLIQTWRVDWFG